MGDIKEKIASELKPFESMCDTAMEHLKNMIVGGDCYDANEIMSVAKTLGEIIDMKKDVVEMCYKKYILDAMEEEGEEPRYYDGRMRDARGRYMRRGYEDDHEYVMTPSSYKEHHPEYWRDMDKMDKNVMYYTENNQSGYDMAKRGYEEARMKHPDDKQKSMEKLEEWLRKFQEDINMKMPNMDNNEKAMVRNKLQMMAQKVQ